MATPIDPTRLRRVRHLQCTAPGAISIAVCHACGRLAPLPYEALVRRFGELYPADEAVASLRCRRCGAAGATVRTARLCDPACPRWRD